MKKFVAILCTLALVLSLATAAFAITGDAENMLAAPVEVSAVWDFEQVKIMTTNWGGAVDPAILVEGGKLVVTYTGTENAICLALNGNGGWQQFNTPLANEAYADGWAATYTYADMVGVYGPDLSTLGAIQVAATATPVTVTGVYWVVEAEEPVQPPVEVDPAPSTGDSIGIVVALLAVSGAALVVLKKKEN